MSFYDEILDTEEKGDTAAIIQGIVLGEVKENWDKDHPGMLKVKLLLADEEKSLLDWVPFIVPYAGNGFGFYFLPEIGSQVVVAFYMGHADSPYVIGCCYNKTNVIPAETADKKNTNKHLLTKGGNQITISDEEGKEKITVCTNGKLQFELDDENQKMCIKDKEAANAIEIDTKNGAISFTADKTLTFKVNKKDMLILDGNGGKVSLKADSVEIEAGQKLSAKGQNTTIEGSSTKIKGQNIKVESQAALALKGSASFKAESSGIVEIKGTMLKLN